MRFAIPSAEDTARIAADVLMCLVPSGSIHRHDASISSSLKRSVKRRIVRVEGKNRRGLLTIELGHDTRGRLGFTTAMAELAE